MQYLAPVHRVWSIIPFASISVSSLRRPQISRSVFLIRPLIPTEHHMLALCSLLPRLSGPCNSTFPSGLPPLLEAEPPTSSVYYLQPFLFLSLRETLFRQSSCFQLSQMLVTRPSPLHHWTFMWRILLLFPYNPPSPTFDFESYIIIYSSLSLIHGHMTLLSFPLIFLQFYFYFLPVAFNMLMTLANFNMNIKPSKETGSN